MKGGIQNPDASRVVHKASSSAFMDSDAQEIGARTIVPEPFPSLFAVAGATIDGQVHLVPDYLPPRRESKNVAASANPIEEEEIDTVVQQVPEVQ